MRGLGELHFSWLKAPDFREDCITDSPPKDEKCLKFNFPTSLGRSKAGASARRVGHRELCFKLKYSLYCFYFRLIQTDKTHNRGGSRIFFRGGGGCTRLLLYFNTNEPHSFFFSQNASCIRKPQVISGGVRTPCTLPLDPPLHNLFVLPSKQ